MVEKFDKSVGEKCGQNWYPLLELNIKEISTFIFYHLFPLLTTTSHFVPLKYNYYIVCQ